MRSPIMVAARAWPHSGCPGRRWRRTPMWSAITAALTGPPASTYAPAIEALRIYVDRVNAAGGVNGKKINLVIEDDSAQPSKAAANAKKLLTARQRRVAAQRQPVLDLCAGDRRSQERRRAADVRRLGLPEGCLSAGQKAEFCTTAFAATYDSRAALAFVKETAKEPVKIGFAAMAIPLSRGEIDFAESQAPDAGHDRGRQGGHSAADRRLHAVRDQAQGCRRQLGVLLGAVGDAGAHLRSAAASRLVGRLYRLGAS